jgi:hypothetical protein
MKLLNRFRELDFNTKVIVTISSFFVLIILLGFFSNFIKSFEAPAPVPTTTSVPNPSDTPDPDDIIVPDINSEVIAGELDYTLDISLSNEELSDVLLFASDAASDLCKYDMNEPADSMSKRYALYLSPDLYREYPAPTLNTTYIYRKCFILGTNPDGFNEELKVIRVTGAFTKKTVSYDQLSLPENQRKEKSETSSFTYLIQKIDNQWKIIKIS